MSIDHLNGRVGRLHRHSPDPPVEHCLGRLREASLPLNHQHDVPLSTTRATEIFEGCHCSKVKKIHIFKCSQSLGSFLLSVFDILTICDPQPVTGADENGPECRNFRKHFFHLHARKRFQGVAYAAKKPFSGSVTAVSLLPNPPILAVPWVPRHGTGERKCVSIIFYLLKKLTHLSDIIPRLINYIHRSNRDRRQSLYI